MHKPTWLNKKVLARVIPGIFAFQIAVVVPISIASGSDNVVTRGITSAPTKPLASTEIVHLGIEPMQVANVDLGKGTWEMSFYVWWRWKGSIDPVESTYMTNNTGATTNTVISYSFVDPKNHNQQVPKLLKDGYYYQQAFISMGFSDEFPLVRYPLDVQDLQVRVENTTYDNSQLQYVVDHHVSKDKDLVVPGWTTKDIVYSEYMHHYGTDFGYTDRGADFQDYSLLTFNIHIERPLSHFFGKLMLPLIVVLLAAVIALFLKAGNFDTRLALAGTGLLTLIFLQQGYSAELPNPVPVVLMDKIYALAYASVLITFFRVIWTTDRVHRKREDEELFVRSDRRLAYIIFGGFALGTIFFIAF